MDVKSLGIAIRARRKQLALRQGELAALANVGNRFVSELENGKPTLEVGKVLLVAQVLGLEMTLTPRTWTHIENVLSHA